MLEYTEPQMYLYDPASLDMFVMDDFGNAVQIPRHIWYS